MSEKHTPGPWLVSTVVGRSPDEAGRYWRSFTVSGDDGTFRVCSSPNFSDDYRAENEANARLIAAAPELLSLVKRFVALPSGAWHPERHAAEEAELVTDARAAIAKATGND